MLNLTRKAGQGLKVGPDINVSVIGVQGRRVALEATKDHETLFRGILAQKVRVELTDDIKVDVASTRGSSAVIGVFAPEHIKISRS